MESQTPCLSEPPRDILASISNTKDVTPHCFITCTCSVMCQAQLSMPSILELRLQRQEDPCGVQASLGYIVNPCFRNHKKIKQMAESLVLLL